jgi:hypothetical protein
MAPRLEAEDPLFGNHPTSKVLSSITSQVSWGKKKKTKGRIFKSRMPAEITQVFMPYESAKTHGNQPSILSISINHCELCIKRHISNTCSLMISKKVMIYFGWILLETNYL